MEPLKNQFSPGLVSCLAGHLKKHLPDFDNVAFESSILSELERLELKARVQCIADALQRVLPKDRARRNRVLLAIMHPLEDADSQLQSNHEGIRGWGMLPLSAVIGQHGIDDFESSLALLKEMTTRFSTEFDVRYFLLEDQDRALKIMATWVKDPNRHVRRLVSEGTRPRLPWAMQLPRLIADPKPVLPLLKALRDDEESYVRRSVANHLNDISKDHPDLVADVARTWMKGGDENRKKLLRHACRSLIKQGHASTLEAFGYPEPQIQLQELTIATPAVTFGQNLEFEVRFQSLSDSAQPLIVDYVLHFKKAKGHLAAKVFKWTTRTLEPNQEVVLKRSHAIRQVTTRKYYEGAQALSLRVNGRDFGYKMFQLVC